MHTNSNPPPPAQLYTDFFVHIPLWSLRFLSKFVDQCRYPGTVIPHPGQGKHTNNKPSDLLGIVAVYPCVTEAYSQRDFQPAPCTLARPTTQRPCNLLAMSAPCRGFDARRFSNDQATHFHCRASAAPAQPVGLRFPPCLTPACLPAPSLPYGTPARR